MEVLYLSGLFRISKKIGFIGSGNMGGAIIHGIIKSGVAAPGNIFVSDPNTETRSRIANETKCQLAADNRELVNNSDVVIFAVKPNILPYVLEEIRDAVRKDQLLISIVAGKSIGFYKSYLGEDKKIVRTMPNTPAMVSEGMTIICYDSNINEDDKGIVEEIFNCVGKVEVFPEKLMNEVIALTSSSPAYVYIMIEAMADAAVYSGIPRDVSYRLAAQAVAGAARMVLETGKHPGELKDMVCSPGGTTIAAVAELEKLGFRDAIISAMKSCTERAYSISNEKG